MRSGTTTPMNLKIAQKGLLLVCVPLLSQFVFIGFLLLLQIQTERTADLEAHSKLVIYRTERAQRSYWAAISHAVLSIALKDPSFQESFEQSRSETFRALDDLGAVVRSDPAQEEKFRKLNVEVHRALDAIANSISRGNMGPLERYIVYNRLRSELFKSMIIVRDGLTSIADSESQRVKALPLGETKSRTAVRIALLFGAIASMVITVLLSRFFSRDITQRLSVLVRNSQRLAERKELLPAVAGADEIKQLDTSFRSMVVSLRQVEQLKHEFLDMITHDLRTPLSSINNFLFLLASGALGEMPEKAGASIPTIERIAIRMAELIDDILDVEKIQSGRMDLKITSCSVAKIVADAVENVQGFANTNSVSVQADKLSDLQLEADCERIVQVLQNLLSNAIKYSPAGEIVRVEVKSTQNRFCEISVFDHGPGIPREFQESIFDRFVQIDDPRYKRSSSSGLGLAICKSLVELHGGSIGVESEELKGSRFWLSLPLRQPTGLHADTPEYG